MDDILLHDYTFNEADKYSSGTINQIVNDFVTNISGLYVDYKNLVSRYNSFLTNMNAGLDWLTTQNGILTLDEYAISGYDTSSTFSNIHLDSKFGSFYLQETDIESKISRYLNSKGKEVSYDSNKVYNYTGGNWVLTSSMNEIINNTYDIWSTTDTSNEMYISIVTSPTSGGDKKANMIEIFPFAGTLIKTVEYKTNSGTYESITVNSTLPVKLIGDFDYADEVRILMSGVLTGSSYYYSLRYVNVYRCGFMDSGTVEYPIGSFTSFDTVNINTDYIADSLKSAKPVRIEIYSLDESVKYYDSNIDAFPLSSVINVAASAVALKAKITLTKVVGVTPMIKYIDIN